MPVLLVFIDRVQLGAFVQSRLAQRTLGISRGSYLRLGLELLLLRFGSEGQALLLDEATGRAHREAGDDLRVSRRLRRSSFFEKPIHLLGSRMGRLGALVYLVSLELLEGLGSARATKAGRATGQSQQDTDM